MTAADLGVAPSRAPAPFRPFHKWDRNFFALLVALIWLGIVMGFGSDMIRHVRSGEAPYPLIVHFHAAAFVGWLVLLTVQVALVRAGRTDIHRKLGVVGAGLAAVMLVLGPATAIHMDALHFGTPGSDPAFMAIQFTDILAFAGLVGAAILLRRNAAAHKRLILLATLYISDAGFSRWLGNDVGAALGSSPAAFFAVLYLGNDLLVLALGGYDLVTRGRLHNTYVAGIVWVFANQTLAVFLHTLPQWQALSLRLIGH
jgi:hypothetical protein